MKSQLTLPTILAIFGATGDLTSRKLVPALWDLFEKGLLPDQLMVVGFARQDISHDAFRERVKAMLPRNKGGKVNDFLGRFFYQQGQFEDKAGYEALASFLGRQDAEWRTCANKLFYLAVPPQYYKTIFQNLADSGLTIPCGPDEGWTRVIVEKPFGKDEATAQELDGLLGRLFKEEQIYRIDHYLGKETVRNVLAFRFSNSFLEPAWDARSISRIDITMTETLGVEGRADFYDEVGALRDVGQNHLLQLLALFAMEHPEDFSAESIRAARTQVLAALETKDVADVARQTVRGQYAGYRDLKGVAAKSQTETFFELQAHVNTPRWRGVPFFLKGGKGLSESKFEVVVTFRHQLPCLCPPGMHYVNQLHYRVQPSEGMWLSFWVKKPGTGMVLEQKNFAFDYRQAYKGEEFIDAYPKLLLDAINGDQTLFVSTQEIAASWKFIDPIVDAWAQGAAPLEKYEVGGEGPANSAGRLLWPPRGPGIEKANKEIAYIGLGKMGANMVERLREHGWSVVAYDGDEAARIRAQQKGVSTAASLAELMEKVTHPRTVWLMVPHQAVDEVLAKLRLHLQPGDTVIDAGNSFFKDSIRRSRNLEKRGIHFLDVGVSGGPSGARAGACLMIGGDKQQYKKHMGLFGDIATAGGYDYMGKAGAGHFVKMVHNGIEYGMMQAIAEGFAVMKKWRRGALDLERIANLYNHDSVIESRLVGWLKEGYEKYGQDLVDISGRVDASGEGLWTVNTAKELGIPAPIIAGSLKFRAQSKKRPSYTGQVVSVLRNMFGGHQVRK